MRKQFVLLAATLILISTVAVKPAIAYFTDTVTTEGKILLNLGDGKLDKMDDIVENMVKKISIKNTGDYEVFVRAKAIYPDSVSITLEDSGDWSPGNDGYYYYYDVVNPDDSTSQLKLKISNSEYADFNVIIVQEATQVLYDENGNETADWDRAVSSWEGIGYEKNN